MNKERLIELRNFFAEVPEEKVDMSTWANGFNRKGENKNYSCLTAGCLAGWAAVYQPFVKEGLSLNYAGAGFTPKYQHYCGTAAFSEFFGIEDHYAQYLTNPERYSARREYLTKPIKKEQVLERLDLFILHGPFQAVEIIVHGVSR